MTRDILCPDCGQPTLTPAEDISMGVKSRRVHIHINRYCCCDRCAMRLEPGNEAVAVTTWRGEGEPWNWETDYSQTTPQSKT